MQWPGPFQHITQARRFLLNLSLVLSVLIIAIVFGIFMRNNQLVMETVRQEAASYFEVIVMARAWNSGYGGVYVDKRQANSDEILRTLGIEPDIYCETGKELTLFNHARMTREISQLTSQNNGVTMDLISESPLNPENVPKLPFERKSLHGFSADQSPVYRVVRTARGNDFVYVSPVFVDQSCLSCHGRQGYKLGDIRGAITITIPFDPYRRQLREDALILAGVTVLSLIGLLSVMYFMVWQLAKRLSKAQEDLVCMSVTDELTGLNNRRFIMRRMEEEFHRSQRRDLPMSLLMVDLDHFKEVNDNLGHKFGDLVLKETANRLSLALRDYDIIGRYGGEEFLIVAPDTAGKDAAKLAERLRESVSFQSISGERSSVTMTVSIGVTQRSADDESPDAHFMRVDVALYRAKNDGRDRVVLL